MFTTDIVTHRKFWSETVGLRLDHELDFGNGTLQYRYAAHDSVIKVNHHPHSFVPTPPTGYVGLTIARAGQPAWEGRNPGGEFVRLVPPGTDGVVGIGVTVSTLQPARMTDFFVDALEFERVGPQVARCGDSRLLVVVGAGGCEQVDYLGPTFRYLTIQIFDANDECAAIAKRGGRMAAACTTLGTVAR